MAVIDGRTVKWADWVDETTFGTTPTNPTMSAFPGEVINIEPTSGPEVESYKVLKGATETDPLSCGKTVKTGETHGIKITIKASALTWLPYALMASDTTTYAPGKVEHPISIGLVSDDEFCVYKGCVLQEAIWDFPDMRSANTLTLTYMCQDKGDWSATDYIGTGSHGSAPTDDPYTLADLTSFQYDSAAPSTANLIIESFKMTLSYDMEGVTDLSETAPSKIGEFSFNSRSIQVETSATAMAMGAHDDLITGDDHTISFTCDTKVFTFSALKWTNNPTVGMGPASRVGMTFTSDGEATRLAIA
jgi:hypothetical protein